MAVNLIKSNTLRGVDDRLFSLIKSENDFLSPIIIIVPDQYTQAVERELFRALNIKCSFNIEVLSFYRLAKKFMPSGKPELNQQTAVLLLSKIIKSNANNLKCYSTVFERRNFANEMYAVITSIRNSCISAEQLKKATQGIGGKAGDKYHDIALVYGEYMKSLYDDYSDISVLLDSFVQAIPNIPELKTTSVYLTGFSGMTKNKRAIVDALMANARNFTMGICDISGQDNGRLMPSDINNLLAIAERHGAKLSYKEDSTLAIEQQHAIKQLYSYTLTKLPLENNFFSTHIARNKDEEIRHIAQNIRASIVKGARYRDMAVVGENIDSYSGLISKYFSDYGIPYFMDDKVAASKLPKFKFLQGIYAVIKNGMSQSDVVALVKERLFNCSDIDRNSFENYVLKYSISYSKFLRPFDIGREDEIIRAEKVRQKLVSYIQIIHTKQSGVIEHLVNIDALLKVLDNTPSLFYLNQDDAVTKEFIEIGNTKLSVLLEHFAIMLNDSKMSIVDCLELLLDTMASIKISLAPINIDCVFVGKVGESRLEDVNTLYMIGAKEDTFPTLASDGGILRDRDIELLQEQGIDFEGCLADKVKTSKYEILQLISRAKKSVKISYPLSNGGKSNIVNQINNLFSTSEKLADVNVGYRDSIEDIAIKIGTKSNFHNFIGGLVREKGKGNLARVLPYIYTNCDSERVEKIVENSVDNYIAYGKESCFKDNFVKISGIESFYRCPFVYYADVILKLTERDNGELKVNDMGSFIHRVLELYFTMGYNSKYDAGVSIDIIANELVNKVLNEEKFLTFLAQDESGNLAEYLTKRCAFVLDEVSRILSRSKFQPKYCEFEFGMTDATTAIEISVGEQIYKVRGYIDRVDTLDDSAVLIDYKSSSKVLNASKVFRGEKLQLVLYLDAVMAHGYKRCGGLYYFALPYKYLDEDKESERYSYDGFISSDEELIRAQDCDYDNGTKSHLPIKYKKKDNQFVPIDKFEAKLSDEDFQQLRLYVKQLLSKTIELIVSGFIQPLPIDEACRTCKYTEMCRVKDCNDVMRNGEVVVWERQNVEDNLE